MINKSRNVGPLFSEINKGWNGIKNEPMTKERMRWWCELEMAFKAKDKQKRKKYMNLITK